MFLVAAACTLGVMTVQKLGICHSELLLSQIIERKMCRGLSFWGLAYIPSRICTLAFSLREPPPVRMFLYHHGKTWYITDWWLEQLEKDCKAFAMSCLLVVSYAEPGSSMLNLLIVRDKKITFKKKKRKKTIITFIMLWLEQLRLLNVWYSICLAGLCLHTFEFWCLLDMISCKQFSFIVFYFRWAFGILCSRCFSRIWMVIVD